MRQRIFAVSALLVVLVACRDGPAELVAPVEARTAVQPEVTVSQDAVRTVVQLLDDPFVREMMDGVGAHAASLHRAVRDASIYGTADRMLTLSRVLALTRSELSVRADHGEEDPDDEILRVALELVLEDAAALLEPRPHSVEEELRGRDVVATKISSRER